MIFDNINSLVFLTRGGVLVLALLTVAAASGGEVRFTIHNPASVRVEAVARVALPVPVGLFAGEPPAEVSLDGQAVPVQARVLTRHPGGSIRRLMLSIPVDLAPRGRKEGICRPGKAATPAGGDASAVMVTDRWRVAPGPDRIELRSAGGELLASIEATGPEPGPEPATVQVLDSGPQFVWLRYDRSGDTWNRQCDVQVFRTGELRLVHRIQARGDGDQWTPDFGWKVTAPGVQAADLSEAAAHLMGRDPDSRFADEANADLVAGITLSDGAKISVANPLALRQNRGTFADLRHTGSAILLSSRIEPVENLEIEGLMIQEGAWRFSELAVAPMEKAQLAARLDAPVVTHADWRAYDAVYRSGPPLKLEDPVLRDCVEKTVFALQDMQMKGDDLGSMPWGWSPFQASRDYTSAVRLNHVLYLWEDWFRGGDPRLRAVAHDWCRNYHDLGMYWGPDDRYYGACRRGNAWRDRPRHGPGTFNPRFDNTPVYVHKGWSNFWLMYEETGDPRYRRAAEAAAEWSIRHQDAGVGEARTIGAVADAIKLFEYSGDRKHLDNAVRLWNSLQPSQGPDLLFTQNNKPAVGDDIYIGSDAVGYKTPFVKPYIVQYATNALPYLWRHCPRDERLRNTILALNDWMARVQQAGGGWGYPHPATAGLSWNLEYVHGLLLACEFQPREEYLDAVARNLRPIVQLCARHGWPASGLEPWEDAAQIGPQQRQERYRMAKDRDASRDYTEGRVRFRQSPDNLVYFQVVLRNFLTHRDEASLFERDPVLDQILRLPAGPR